jgi:hypothetical protein
MSTIIAAIGPCVIAAFVAYILTLRAPGKKWADSAAAIAVGIGSFLGIVVLLGTGAWQPTQSTDRIGLSVVALAALGALAPFLAPRAPARVAFRAVVVAALAVFLLLPPIRSTWPWPTSAAWVCCATLFSIAMWQSHDAVVRREPAVIPAVVLLLAMVGACVVLVLGGSAKLGQLGGAVVSAYGGVAGLSTLKAQRFSLTGVMASAWPSLALLFLLSHAYSESPLLPTVLLVVASATPWLAEIAGLRDRRLWQRCLVCACITAALVAGAIGVAFRAYSASDYAY